MVKESTFLEIILSSGHMYNFNSPDNQNLLKQIGGLHRILFEFARQTGQEEGMIQQLQNRLQPQCLDAYLQMLVEPLTGEGQKRTANWNLILTRMKDLLLGKIPIYFVYFLIIWPILLLFHRQPISNLVENLTIVLVQ